MFNSENLNVNTLWFLYMLNELCRKFQNGYINFCDCNLDNKDCDCIFYVETQEKDVYKIVEGFSSNSGFEIISTYDDCCDGVDEVNFVINDDDEPYIQITFINDDSMLIIEKDGSWSMC